MELVSQRVKEIMENCKVRAEAEGLKIHGETLEYIITNQDMIELSPKVMIPTLYDYWVNDVEVTRDKWIYDASPHNPYECAINTRPAISFYNDNNPDWLNSMIFYHVLGHHDFFQNNVFFRKTWDDDFCGQALADKRLVARIREDLGAEKRWVDYVIEFARSLDNLVGYYAELEEADKIHGDIVGAFSSKIEFYFGDFLKKRFDDKNIGLNFYYSEINRLSEYQKIYGDKQTEEIFFGDSEFKSKFPEFTNVFEKQKEKNKFKPKDILQYLMERSEFLKKGENKWMIDILGVVRNTSLYFRPQIITKIINEGWASVWHERLFIADERSHQHEVDFGRVNAYVLADRKLGLNPYIVGKRLLEFIEELAGKGKLSYGYQLIKDLETRKRYDQKLGPEQGKKALFEARTNLNDFGLINFLSDEDFQDFVDKHKLFVAGRRLNQMDGTWEIYIKSKSGKKYRELLNKSLYHPPHIIINEAKANEGSLYLDHVFEGRTLYTNYIPAVLQGLSFLAGGVAKLETTEFELKNVEESADNYDEDYIPEYYKLRVLYTCDKKNLSRTILERV